VRTEIGTLPVEGCGSGRLTVLIRPEAARIAAPGGEPALRGTVRSISFHGPLTDVVVECTSGRTLAFELPTTSALPRAGDRVSLVLLEDGIVCLAD
jgi:hypothetical protein